MNWSNDSINSAANYSVTSALLYSSASSSGDGSGNDLPVNPTPDYGFYGVVPHQQQQQQYIPQPYPQYIQQQNQQQYYFYNTGQMSSQYPQQQQQQFYQPQLQQFSPSAPPALFGLVSVDTAAPTPTTPSTTSTTSIAATSATTTTTTTAIPSTGVTITNVSSRMDPDRGGVIVIGSLPNKDYRHDEFNTSTKKFTFENGNFNAAAAKPADRIVSREINHKAIEQVEEVTMVEATPTKIVVKILGDKGALHFAQHFRGNSTIKQLVIHGPRKNAPKEHFIGHRGFYELLPCFAHLELLKIEGHKIGQEIGAFIADYLANNNQQLTTLDLWANQIEDATALVIVNSLKNMPSIRLINLGENLINTEAKLEIKKLARGSHFKVDMF